MKTNKRFIEDYREFEYDQMLEAVEYFKINYTLSKKLGLLFTGSFKQEDNKFKVTISANKKSLPEKFFVKQDLKK